VARVGTNRGAAHRSSCSDLTALRTRVDRLRHTTDSMNPAHDRINLTRLVARIQRDVDDRSSNDWLVAPETLKQTALHATAVSRVRPLFATYTVF